MWLTNSCRRPAPWRCCSPVSMTPTARPTPRTRPMTATGSAPGVGRHGAVGRCAVEVQQHGPGFRFDNGHRDVVPGEGADHFGGFPERVRGQFDGAVPV